MASAYKRQPKDMGEYHDFANHEAKDLSSTPKPSPNAGPSAHLDSMTKDELKEGYLFLLETIEDLKEEIADLNEKLATQDDLNESEVVDYEEELTDDLDDMAENHGVAATFAYLTNKYGDKCYKDWKISYPVKWAITTKVIKNFCEKHSLKPYGIWVEGEIR